MALITQLNLTQPDDFYEALIDMHRDFDEAQSQAANAQLILLLANHIGDYATLMEAIQYAREGVDLPNSSAVQHTADAPRVAA
ncbi:DUF2783 domain-containing protein [Paraburkholderia caribensis]|uniref:DUF2783 domain-containing protein n=1 Tax=Paraburkholderia caribensis TaxID=75105 RepID=UPI00071F0B8D|nr:DUF2783 domain-containing protein [Paraburkholderia caribensis]ALP65146.1 hypothetical protein AN416_21305 [Paraburkholderia caribensis]AUT53704.1 DUF2783 domain-containing protein [Paraburkholderia caribensis]